MKNIFVVITFFFLISCKNDSNVKIQKESKVTCTVNLDTFRKQEKKISDNDQNCTDYLTELIRSSNFPFENIKKEKVNTIIDEDNGEIVRVKLFFDTDGTGTIGWVEYHIKERKLFNSSANLEDPELLKFNIDYAKKFERCKGISVIQTSENSNSNSIKNLYNLTKLINLPNNYNYEFIVEEENFIKVPNELYKFFDFDNFFNFKIAKLPTLGNIKPIFFIIYDESGQSKLYLITLDLNYKIIDKLKLYDSEELDSGNLSTTYEITKDYKVKIKEAKFTDSGSKVVGKNIKLKNYKVETSGKIQSL